jgi:hypothetical protein
MRQKKLIFGEPDIIAFCKATKDTNQIHDPEIMTPLGKHVIVPGMFVLTSVINLSADFLKTKTNTIRVVFNSLLSSGEFVTLCSVPDPECPDQMRLSAINHKDTLTSKNEYTRLCRREVTGSKPEGGILRRLETAPDQLERFSQLIGADDKDVANFLFAVAYASQALLKSVNQPETEVEQEIDRLIHSDLKISPFYHAFEISFPGEFPIFHPEGFLDYYVRFERGKKERAYIAHLRCEHDGRTLFHATYDLLGISDLVILRMARQIPQ